MKITITEIGINETEKLINFLNNLKIENVTIKPRRTRVYEDTRKERRLTILEMIKNATYDKKLTQMQLYNIARKNGYFYRYKTFYRDLEDMTIEGLIVKKVIKGGKVGTKTLIKAK